MLNQLVRREQYGLQQEYIIPLRPQPQYNFYQPQPQHHVHHLQPQMQVFYRPIIKYPYNQQYDHLFTKQHHHIKTSGEDTTTGTSQTNATTVDGSTNEQPFRIDHKLIMKRYRHNKDLLKYLTPGDVIQFHFEEDFIRSEQDIGWAVYIGQSNLILFNKSTVIMEKYWNLGKRYFLNLDKDFERIYYPLPNTMSLNRALYAFKFRQQMSAMFSSDKNFALWCKFDINKSDIDFSTNLNNQLTHEEIKFITIQRFLNYLNDSKNRRCSTCDGHEEGNCSYDVNVSTEKHI